MKNKKTTNRIVLGLSWNHDAHAAIFIDGQIIASVGEERISRIKNHYGFPFKAIKECLKIANISGKQVDLIAIANTTPHPAFLIDIWFNERNKQYDISNNTYFRVKYLMIKHLILKIGKNSKIYNENYLIKNLKKAFNNLNLKAEFKFYDHHKCHAASAYYSSGFNESFVAVIDQYGDNKCVSFWDGTKNDLKLINSYNDVMSPGAFYTEITSFLGFKRYRHEGKVTGLAAKGDSKKLFKKFKKVLSFNPNSKYFSKIRPLPLISILDKIMYGIRKIISKKPIQTTYITYKKYFDKICYNVKIEDIAAAAQSTVEDFVLSSIKHNKKYMKTKNISLAGGTFANVLVNQKVLEINNIENMFVFPNMGDGGLAVGASQLAFYENNLKFKRAPQKTFFLGGNLEITDLDYYVKMNNLKFNKYKNKNEQVFKIVELLNKDKIIGLVKGRMEFGPRALCNRSIIASPKDNNINKTLNSRLNRTEFMPFAPVIRQENLKKIFPNLKCEIPANFMTVTALVKEKFRSIIPAVVHVDGTARPQIISKSVDPFMHKILLEFEKKTSIPALINTSFNAHEEPIVYSVKDALRAFKAGSVDVLIINDFIIYSE